MYEDKQFIKKRVIWSRVLLKLLLLFLIVFLIWFMFFRNNDNKSKKNNKKGQTMTENLKDFKQESLDYFTGDRLPKNVGEVKKVTLEDMINEKSAKEIYDKDGNKCSNTSSYAQITKADDKHYDLKVYIKCKNEADSILTTLNTNKKSTTKKTTTDDSKKNTNNDTKKTTTDNKNSKTTTEKKKSSTNTSNKSTKETSTVNINSNNNNNTNNNNSTTTNNNVVATNTNTNTGTNTNNNSNTGSNTNQGSSTSQQTTFVPDEKKLLYSEYHLIKYGEWTDQKPTEGLYKVDTLKVNVYKYCWGTDHENCHKLSKTESNMPQINYLLYQGYTEIYDHTNTKVLYLPYELIWSRDKDLPGYTYTGDHRDYYVMN